MPIVAASNGVRPEIRALAVIKLNKPVTPAEINDCVGTGDYAAKYISFLNTRYGFTITAQKDGRRVVSYTCIAEPANAADLRGQKPKSAKVKPLAKAIQKQISKQVDAVVARNKAPSVKTGNVAAKVAAAKAPVAKPRKVDAVAKELGSTGEIAKSFTIDNDWDSMDNVDVKNFLR